MHGLLGGMTFQEMGVGEPDGSDEQGKTSNENSYVCKNASETCISEN